MSETRLHKPNRHDVKRERRGFPAYAAFYDFVFFYPRASRSAPYLSIAELFEAHRLTSAALDEVARIGRTPRRGLDAGRYLAEIVAEMQKRGLVRDHILSVSLFLAGLAGWCDRALAALIADATMDPSAVPVLLDLAEARSLHVVGSWERVEVEWPTRDEHGTGDNPHVWLAVRGASKAAREISGGVLMRQCPCGVFEHGTYVIEFRNGSFFQTLDGAHGGPADTAQKFPSEDAARGFMGQHMWISFNGGMPMTLSSVREREERYRAAMNG